MTEFIKVHTTTGSIMLLRLDLIEAVVEKEVTDVLYKGVMHQVQESLDDIMEMINQ